jgi:hypothetical protein
MTDEIIAEYTDKQAVEDGYLFDIAELKQGWEKGLFNYITSNLLFSKGYLKEDQKVNLPCFVDLLNQANQIVKRKSNNLKDFDTFFSGKIELPSGEKQEIFIAQNGTGKFTIMLPEDY